MTRFLIEVTVPPNVDIAEARKIARERARDQIPLHIVEEEFVQETQLLFEEGQPNPNPKVLKTWWDFHQ